MLSHVKMMERVKDEEGRNGFPDFVPGVSNLAKFADLSV